MQVHIDRDGKRFGPYSVEQVNAHLADGSILPTDLGWTDGMADWVPVTQVAGVTSAEGTPPPPPAAEASMLAKDIAGYEGEYREDYDKDGDGEISVRDSIYQMQIDQGLRNPDGTPATQTDTATEETGETNGGGEGTSLVQMEDREGTD